MPHTPEDKKRALRRLARIKGQVEALERAIEAGTECRDLLQQIAALRGAAGGLMAEILEMHLRDSLARDRSTSQGAAIAEADFDDTMRILRTYLK
jgi:DNA-binding FrmR family transcriptional regulator